MKQKLKLVAKILVAMLIGFLIITYFDTSFAAEVTEPGGNDFWQGIRDGAGALIDGVIGIVLWPIRMIPVLLGGALQLLAGRVASIGADASQQFSFLTMEDVLFNKVPILSINFFSTTGTTETIRNIRTSIATWYLVLRNLAIILSLAVLIYIGIRMAISTLADDKAKYKRMLTDWIIGFITIFLLHYLIVIVINVNDALVNTLYSGIKSTTTGGTATYESVAGFLATRATGIQIFGFLWGDFEFVGFIEGMESGIVYVILVVFIIMFLFNYIKRMLTIAFLVVIAPIITVTYSIDKIGDGKSQALNTWLKEFIYNVIIQPFHCIIYLVFMNIILEIIHPDHFAATGIGAAVIAIVIMIFMKNAENIVKKIFGFDNASSLGSAVASGALLLNSMKTASNAVSKIKGSSSESGGNEKKKQNKPQTKSSKDGSTPTPPNGRGTLPSKSGNTQQQNSGGSLPSGSGNGQGRNGQQQSGSSQQQGANGQQQSGGGNLPNGQNGGNLPDGNGNAKDTPDTIDNPRKKEGLEKLGRFVKGQVKAGVMITGAAMGLAAGNDPLTGILTGMNYGKAFHAGGSALGERAITGVKKLGNRATQKGRTYNLQNNLIDSHKNLQDKTGWNNEQMSNFAEYAMMASDKELDAFSPEMKKYAQDVKKLQSEYASRKNEKNPEKKVLDTIKGIQDGTVKLDQTKTQRFTSKVKTPISAARQKLHDATKGPREKIQQRRQQRISAREEKNERRRQAREELEAKTEKMRLDRENAQRELDRGDSSKDTYAPEPNVEPEPALEPPEDLYLSEDSELFRDDEPEEREAKIEVLNAYEKLTERADIELDEEAVNDLTAYALETDGKVGIHPKYKELVESEEFKNYKESIRKYYNLQKPDDNGNSDNNGDNNSDTKQLGDGNDDESKKS